MSIENSPNHPPAVVNDLAAIAGQSDGAGAKDYLLENHEQLTYPLVEGQLDDVGTVRNEVDVRSKEELEQDARVARIAGRIASIRLHANYAFIDVADDSGAQIQIIVPRKSKTRTAGVQDESTDATADFLRSSRQGNIVLVTGRATKSRSGEPSLMAESAPQLLAPAVISPDRLSGNSAAGDRLERVRQFESRAKMKASIRNNLEQNGYVEVVTPTLSSVPSGANAETFTTRVESLDMTAYLRIAPEIALKTAIVNGYGRRVYEFATNFRNEGIDREHSPEFEMLEFYSAFTTAAELRDFTVSMVADATFAATGTHVISIETEEGSRVDVDMSRWSRTTYREIFNAGTGIDLDQALQLDEASLRDLLLGYLSSVGENDRAAAYQSIGVASLIDKVFKLKCRPHIQQPTLVEQYPAIMVPLARPSDSNPLYVDMFQGIVASLEVIKGYQELNDPVRQLSNLYAQAAAREAGDVEAMAVDWQYLATMLKGLPPTAGCGIGIDRLAAIIGGTKNIHARMPYPFRERFARTVALEG